MSRNQWLDHHPMCYKAIWWPVGGGWHLTICGGWHLDEDEGLWQGRHWDENYAFTWTDDDALFFKRQYDLLTHGEYTL